MSDGHVLLLLLPEGSARLRWTRDVDSSLRNSFYRGGRYLCVGAVRCSPEDFAGFAPPMGTYSMVTLADVPLTKMTVDADARVAVGRHNPRVLDAAPDEARGIVAAWREVGGKQYLTVAKPGSGARGGQPKYRETSIQVDPGSDDGPGRRGGGMFSADWYDRLVIDQLIEGGHGATIIEPVTA